MLDLTNLDNWALVWENSTQAQRLEDKTYIPIPEIICPFPLNKSLIAIEVSSVSALKEWALAAYLNQIVNIANFGTYSKAILSSNKVFFKKVNLVSFPLTANEYFLYFKVPYYIEDITLKLWKYTGLEENTNIDLQTTLQRIEQKIDDISNYSGGV